MLPEPQPPKRSLRWSESCWEILHTLALWEAVVERPLGRGTEELAQCWVGSRMASSGSDISLYIQTPEATESGWPEAQQLQSHKGQVVGLVEGPAGPHPPTHPA